MYLKRLEIVGFKSFAEKTELEFGPGITAVVGPNGSGKSNVADAIRWVLGEQSAKALRGGSMADVIFAGSSSKKAMGYAEVSLVLDNSDGKLDVGFNEVMVTRRVDRSGEGEYFINRVPCRLKDVHDLFLDTGVGKDNYSIIGQGKIDEILSSKPEDRRALFEEAAGISRYKSRKKEAQRRLDETENNLLRITDIIGELAGQIETLREQAEKAEVYNGLHGEMTQLDLGLIAFAIDQVRDKLSAQLLENEEMARRLSEIEQKLQEGEQAAEVSRNLAESLDQELSVIATQVAEATGQLERAEGKLALAEQEQKVKGQEQYRLEHELAAILTKLEKLEGEQAAVRERMRELQAEADSVAAELRSQEQHQQAEQAELAAASRTVEAKKDRIIQILQLEAERKNAVLSAERAGEEAAKRKARLNAERARAEADMAQVEQQRAELVQTQAKLQQERDEAVKAVAQKKGARLQLEQELAELSQRGGAIREQIQGASSRLGAIEEMMNAFEGYQRGTRTVLLGRERGEAWAAEVEGAVAEVIRTEPRYEKAIETALGGAIQNLITTTDQGAKKAIEHLKRVGGGRATFLPLNTIRANTYRPDEQREFTGAPGILGVALDLVRFDEKFRPAMASLLGRTLIAESMDAALAFGRRTGQRYRVVTLEGELLAAGGALTGGSAGNQGGGLLSREREREELTEKLNKLRAELTAARQAYDEAQAKRPSLEQEVQEAEGALRALETRITQAEGEAARVAGELKRWQDVLKTFGYEAEAIDADAKQGAEQAEQLREDLVHLAQERSSLEAEVTRLNLEGQARMAALDEASRELTARQVRLAELNQQVKGQQAEATRLTGEVETLLADRLEREEQLTAVTAALEQAAVDLATAKSDASTAGAEKTRLEGERSRVYARKLEVLEQQNAREREMRAMRRDQTSLQNRRQQGEVEEARLRMEQESLTTRLHEQHGMVPGDLVGRALPEGEVKFAKARVAELREQIRELGPVNLAAIEEYKNATERYTFLEQQRLDLEEAKEALYRAVEELEKKIKVHFLESFQVIRGHFQQVYAELFEGGKADLQLVDEENLLETGIDIIAQPPGKKAQNLSLLSGGERAMTAIALLFALLRVKPTPFTVLDEVEAALDEANVERFGRFLKLFATGGSQFICISHQRGTMEAADALYGVTMEGTGISRVVSVRLIDVAQEAS